MQSMPSRCIETRVNYENINKNPKIYLSRKVQRNGMIDANTYTHTHTPISKPINYEFG